MNQGFSAQALTRKTHHKHKQAGGAKKVDCKMQQTCNRLLYAWMSARIT